MNNNPACPVCDASDWDVIGSRTYDRAAMETADEYVRKRLRVLFEIWYPGEQQVENRSLLCGRCGFVTYAPRPTADDLDRKYRFLGSLGTDENRQQITPERESQRAARLWKKLARFADSSDTGRSDTSGSGLRVLDFGGGDGRLVVPFAEHGCDCFVVDYAPQSVAQVTRLGTTLDDLDEDERFDIVVCSHVIEHVADPLATMSQLRDRMTDGGAIYVEVPMEIWKRPPLHEEPVTHVNFFTVESLQTLLQRAGLEPVSVKLEDYPHPLGHRTVVVSSVARRMAGSPPRVDHSGAAGTRRLLNPPLATRLQRALLRPQDLPQAAWHQVKRRLFS